MEALQLDHLLAALVYAVIGVIIFVAVFALIDIISPKDLWGEIADKQNTAMATLAGFVALGICIIIAAAMIG
ncbi:MAG: DUF350 domain-containing protein [Candidatus Hydrogenedentota bacterium]|nr:MAG: DUF350 domain-containing protein [Candidatus Hydrogenedentota bacterium]